MGDNNQAYLLAGGNDWISNSSSNTCGNYTAEHRNSSGFTIIPAGSMNVNGVFGYEKSSSSFWTSTASNSTKTYKCVFDYNGSTMNQSVDNNERAFSVRCVRDNVDMINLCYVTNAHENDEYDNESLSNDNPCLIESVNIGGDDYGVVQIGGRCWTKENLRTTVTVSGSQINQHTSGTSSLPAYYNFATQYGFGLEESGYLYNWYAASQICPNGWHLPTKDEWRALSNYAGNANKLALDYQWSTNDCNIEGSPCKCMSQQTSSDCNILGFSLVPAGNTNNGSFQYYRESANFWTGTSTDNNTANRIFFNSNQNIMNDTANNEPTGNKKSRGFSVRCIRDL